MQLTKLDHWLKQKFVHQTHILSLRLPEKKLPRGVHVTDLEVKKRGDYKYKMVIKKNHVADMVSQILKDEHIMHATHIIDCKSKFKNFVMPPNGKSFTWQMIGRLTVLSVLCSFLFGLYTVSQNAAFMDSFLSAWEEFKANL